MKKTDENVTDKIETEEDLIHEEAVEKIKEKLENLSEEQQNYVLFKIFMEQNESRDKLIDALTGKIDGVSKWYVIGVIIDLLRKRNISKKEEIDAIANTQKDYKNVL